jgi:hypothetical protein
MLIGFEHTDFSFLQLTIILYTFSPLMNSKFPWLDVCLLSRQMVSEAWARLSMDTHPDDLSVYLICVLYVEVIIFLREAAASLLSELKLYTYKLTSIIACK